MSDQTDQNTYVRVIGAACDVIKKSKATAKNVWEMMHKGCDHYSETSGCIMNGKDIINCTFKGCPYISY